VCEPLTFGSLIAVSLNLLFTLKPTFKVITLLSSVPSLHQVLELFLLVVTCVEWLEGITASVLLVSLRFTHFIKFTSFVACCGRNCTITNGRSSQGLAFTFISTGFAEVEDFLAHL
jgi:hypothetical protein